MIRTLDMKAWTNWGGGINDFWKSSTGELLCGVGAREIFDIPEGMKRITVCVSDSPVDDVVKAIVAPRFRDLIPLDHNNSLHLHFFDGAVSETLNDRFAHWLGRAPIWLWIEY